MTLLLSAGVVVEILRGEKPHYRRFLEAAVAAGEAVRICSLCLHQLAHAALRSPRPEPRLDQLDALMAHVEVEPFTGEDAMTAARLQAEWERSFAAGRGLGAGLLDLMAAGQALNRGWTLVVDEPARAPGDVPALYWGDPAGPEDLAGRIRRVFSAGR